MNSINLVYLSFRSIPLPLLPLHSPSYESGILLVLSAQKLISIIGFGRTTNCSRVMVKKLPPPEDKKLAAAVPAAAVMTFDDTVDQQMAEFEARTNARADALQGSVAELTALLQLVVGQNASDRRTYAAIAEVELEIPKERNELLALITPPISLSQLNISPPCQTFDMLQLVPNRHLKILPPSDIMTWPTDVDSSNVTTQYSSGRSSLRPNMPLTIEELTLDTPADVPHGDEASTIEHASVLVETVLSDASHERRKWNPVFYPTPQHNLVVLNSLMRIDQDNHSVHCQRDPPVTTPQCPLFGERLYLLMIWTEQKSMHSMLMSPAS
jgi:hypothetical protein